MKFATLGHLMVENDIELMPKEWIYDRWIYSPEINLNGTKGHIAGLKLTAKEMMNLPLDSVRQKILDLAIIGAYGIIGEAVSKILVPEFDHSILIGRRETRLEELKTKIKGNFETKTKLLTKNADVIVTATSHPTALLKPEHLKKDVIVIDVSQPSNLSQDVCKIRPDVFRVDGGFVDLPNNFPYQIPGIPKGKIFSCVAEVIMQALENNRKNHVGSIDLDHLKKTEEWGRKYDLYLKKITNFGMKIKK